MAETIASVGGQGLKEMSFFNTEIMRPGDVKEHLSRLFAVDPFEELARTHKTEVHLSHGQWKIFKNIKIGSSLTFDDATNQVDDLGALSSGLKRGDEIVISIPEEACLSFERTFPKASALKISAMTALELLRLTPFSRTDVFADWMFQPDQVAPDEIKVKQVVIGKDHLRSTIAAVKQAGARPTAIIVRNREGYALNLAIAMDGHRYFRKESVFLLKTLAAGAFALLLGFFAFGCAGAAQEASQIAAIDEGVKAHNKTAMEVRAELDDQQKLRNSVIQLGEFRRKLSNRTAVILGLTTLLLDDTSFQSLSFDGEEVMADGMGRNPEKLVGMLEASPFAEDVGFVAPIQRNPGESKSRFSLKFKLKPGVSAK